MASGAAFYDGLASQGLALGAAAPPIISPQREQSVAVLNCSYGPQHHGDPLRPLGNFLTKYVLTLDENGTLATIPPWGFVREYVDAWESGEDVHIEKTRQMLASWLGCAAMLHSIMFKEGFTGFLASRKQQLVDDGGQNSTHASLLGRMRFVYNHLPEDLKDFSPVAFSFLHAIAPRANSAVIGEGTSDNTGRGGTWSKALMDEAAFFEHSEAVHMSIRPACARGLIYQSTPNGKANAFARIKFKDPGGFRFLRLHWTKHPLRSAGLYFDESNRPRSPWYNDVITKYPPDQVAREYDISYEHSVAGLVYAEFDPDRHVRKDCTYDPQLPLGFCMDFGIGAPTSGVFFQVHGPEFWVIGSYEKSNEDVDFHAEAIWAKAGAIGFKGEKKHIRMYGDPAGNAREMTNKSSTVVRAYRAHGFTNFTTPRHPVKDGIRLVKSKMHRNRFYVHPACTEFLEKVSDYRYPTDDAGNVLKDEPIHDHASHIMDAVRYGVTGVFPIDDSASTGMHLKAPAPLKTPVPFGPEMSRHEYRDPFRPIMSGKRDF